MTTDKAPPPSRVELGSIPNLGSVVTAADVSTKGTGSYAAEYVNWCRVTQVLRDHAPGWQFHLRPTAEGQHVWEAPNGTGYIIGFFVGPNSVTTPDFPQAVMDNRNAPVPMERISARDVTDTHRRCLCTAAAAAFGLAWQLWAKEPLEDPHQREDSPAAARPGTARPITAKPQDPSPDRTELVPAVYGLIVGSELTQDGIRTLLLQFGDGQAKTMEDLPTASLRSIIKLMEVPSKVALLNRGLHTVTRQPLLDVADDANGEDDPPMTWTT